MESGPLNRFQLKIEPRATDEHLFSRLYSGMKLNRMDTPLGWTIMLAISMALALLVVKKGMVMGIVLLVLIIALPIAIFTMFNLKFGIVLTVALSFFLLGIKRIIGDVQLGLAMDGLISLMFFGLFAQQVKSRDWSFAKNRISYAVLIWMFYNFLEVGNPAACSRLAWVYTVRSMAGLMVMYFIVLYAMDSEKFAVYLIKLWIVLAFVGALYGLKQEYIGFAAFEDFWVTSDKERFALLFQMGRFRKFSFFSDPMVFGFVMGYTGVLCFTLLSGPFSILKKIFLVVAGICMLLSLVYSGTRAAYVLIPIGLFFYVVMTMKTKFIAAGVAFLIFGIIFINVPINNVNVIRIQSAFKPGEDASYNTRKRNQERIKPYLYSHPMGGGLGSVGDWGEKFCPGSFLSTFPPDSGYIRIVVEMGPIGLALYLYLLYVVMSQGVINYFKMRDDRLKSMMLALLCTMYTLVIANFPQEAIAQIPTSLLFYVMIALVNKMLEFDQMKSVQMLNYKSA